MKPKKKLLSAEHNLRGSNMESKTSPVNFFAICLILFLLVNSETAVVARKILCEKRSLTWSGKCGETSHCDRQCKNWEYAKHRACHKRQGSWKCLCYFDC